MPCRHPALPSEPDGGFGDRLKPVGSGIVGLVGVKIEIEIAVARQRENSIKFRRGIVDDHRAENAAVIGDQIRKSFAIRADVVIDHRQRTPCSAMRPAQRSASA